jgi:hypothetical protein
VEIVLAEALIKQEGINPEYENVLSYTYPSKQK